MLGHAPIPWVPNPDDEQGLLGRSTLWWLSAGGFLVMVVANDLVEQLTWTGAHATPTAWLGGIIAFTWLTLVWNGTIPQNTAELRWTMAAIVAMTLGVHLAFGYGATESVRVAFGVLVAACVQAVVYRGLRGLSDTSGVGLPVAQAPLGWRQAWRRQWTPTGVRDATLLLVASAVSGYVGAVIGVTPGLWAGSADPELLVRWGSRSGAVAFVGGAGVMMFFQLLTAEEWRRRRNWLLIPLVAISVIFLHLSMLGGDLPITWLVLIPAIYVGATFSPWASSVHFTLVGLCSVVMVTLPYYANSFGARLSPEFVVGVLLMMSTYVTMALSLLTQDRKGAVDELEEEKADAAEQAALLRTVFDSMNDGVILFDKEGQVSIANTSARHLLGRPLPARASDDWISYYNVKTLDGRPATIMDIGGLGASSLDSTTVMVDNVGSRRLLDIGTWPLIGGRDNALLMLLSDTTAEHERLENLTRFAGTVAHDLRSPLTGLQGWLELAQEALEDGHYDDAMLMVSRSRAGTNRMKQVIEDWLDYVVSRDGQVQPTRVDLQPLVTEVVSPYRDAGHLTGASIIVDTPHQVMADPALLRQMVANLVSNAVKYTPEDRSLRLHIKSMPAAESGMVQVEISDRGAGIPEGEEQAIFEEFRRSSRHQDDKAGTGLGLSLCMRVAHRHGGAIWARNNPDGGATFAFTLPTG